MILNCYEQITDMQALQLSLYKMNPERFEEKIAEYSQLVEVDLSNYDNLGIS